MSSCTIAGVTDGDVFRRDGEGLGGSPLEVSRSV